MENQETVVLCPNCRWRARGTDEQALNAAKDRHGMYECPLPAAAGDEFIEAIAS